ncbi:MAG: redoxin domain-containing protein [Candidatus Delongbacteria bacterium]
MKRLLLVGLFGLLGVARAEYAVGVVPPDFTCTDWNGNTWNLADNLGKVVLLNFGATWCGPCNDEMPELQSEFYETYDPAGFAIVHIDTDGITAQALHNHWDALGVTFPVLVGCDDLYSDYGDGYIPYNCLLDTEGEILYAGSGYNPGTLHALIEANMSIDHPVFALQGLSVTGDDNGDGRPDAGESVQFVVDVRNSPIAVPATACTVTLSCDDPAVTITNGTVSYPAADPGETVAGAGSFAFTVADGITPHWATFTFSYSAPYAGGTATGEMLHEQRMGRPNLLLVDSDGATDDNESFVQTALTALGMESDLWTAAGALTGTEMGRYTRIIWLGGVNETDMSDDEEAGLRAFVDAGGQLLLSSQYLSDNPARLDFLQEVFGVTVADDDGGNIFLMSCPAGDPYFGGAAMVISGNQAANNNEDPDVLASDGSSTVFATWTQAGNAPAAVYTTAAGRQAIFCGFPVEANRVHTSAPGSVTVQGFLEHALAYFGEVAVDEPAPLVASGFRILGATPNPFNPVTRLDYRLEAAGDVSVSLFNVLGQEVRRLVPGARPAGEHSLLLDASDLASGLYLARLSVNGQARDTHKLMLVK